MRDKWAKGSRQKIGVTHSVPPPAAVAWASPYEEQVKKKAVTKNTVPLVAPLAFDELLRQLRTLIQEARQQALRAVDVVQVRTCWEVGRHIVEFEQGGAGRAQYGAKLLTRLAERLTTEFGKGFDERNLRHMRAFFLSFPIWNAVRTELSWTHYRTLLRETEVSTMTRHFALHVDYQCVALESGRDFFRGQEECRTECEAHSHRRRERNTGARDRASSEHLLRELCKCGAMGLSQTCSASFITKSFTRLAPVSER
jgi:hypothetical protein